MDVIETFYAIDYDRCLGNFDAHMALVNVIVANMSNLDGGSLAKANKAVKDSGRSFSILRFLQENDPNLDLDLVQKEYINRAQLGLNSLLEPGALNLIDFLLTSNYQHCIMTFGDERWQTTKIVASGLGDTVTLVVNHERKSHIIAGWWDKDSGYFTLPKECFKSGGPRLAKEVVLIDDKLAAFQHLSTGARGYLVSSAEVAKFGDGQEVPKSVTRVGGLDEIIELEKLRKNDK